MRSLRMLLHAATALTGSICAASEGGFLFSTFRGEETPMSEQVYFGFSRDGLHWQALNGGEPVLVSELGRRGVRDPFLIRSPDSDKFYLLGTDLSINLTPDWGRAVREGSRSILIWESEDLVNWSEPRLVPVAPEDAGCAWAPEAIYDPETQEFLLFWASTSASDDFGKHRMWARRTKDFRTFSEPFIYIERDVHVIDTNIVNDNGTYYRFTKDETHKSVVMESSASLDGPWSPMPEFTLAKLQGYEGPQCFMLEAATDEQPAKWCLMMDRYSRSTGYDAFITTDLASGHFEPAPSFSFPFRFRHGSILPIDAAEYARLEAELGSSTD